MNDCPNLLSYGATFRMGVLLPNYPQDIVVKGENLPHFSKMSGSNTGNSTLSGTLSSTLNGTLNVFQILNNTWKRQRAVQCQYDSSTIPTVPELASPFRTTTPFTPASMTATAKQANPVHVSTWGTQNTSWSGPPALSAHVHKPLPQVLKCGDSLALRKVQHSQNGRTSVNRLPLMKQDILSHYSGCFEGIGCFPGEPHKFT